MGISQAAMRPALRLATARRRLAAGGAVKAVRNFLTGIAGSRLDQVLEDLKGRAPTWEQDMPEGEADARRVANRAQDQAIGNWIDRNLRNYIIRQHGTENDPLKDVLGEQYNPAITKRSAADVFREHYGPLYPDMVNTSDAPPWLKKLVVQDYPRAYAESAHANDVSHVMPKSDADLTAKLAEIDAAHPARNTPPVELHDIDRQLWDRSLGPKLNDTLDYLRTLDPRSLPQVSVPDAIRKSDEWHAAMAKKASEADRSLIDQLPVTKQYPNGAKWVKATDIDPEANPGGYSRQMDAITNIGKALGHCYQNPNTCDSYLASGELHTLIDPTGKPRVTLEVGPMESGQRGIYQADRDGNPVQAVQQVRGPQNGETPEDALPYLKDYLNHLKPTDVPQEVQDQLGVEKYTTRGGFPIWLGNKDFTSDMARWRIPQDGTTKLVPMDQYADYAAREQALKTLGSNYGKPGAEQALKAMIGPAKAQVLKGLTHEPNRFMSVRSPDAYDIPDDWLPPSAIQEKASGGMVDEISNAARDLLSRVRGETDFERAQRREAQARAAVTADKLDEYKDKTARNLTHFGLTPTPKHAAMWIDQLLEAGDPVQDIRELGRTGAEFGDKANVGNDLYNQIISETEGRENLPSGLLARLIARESGFNPKAVSKVGALGIAQFMPETAQALGVDPMDPAQAIPAAGSYLHTLYSKLGDWKSALAAYNWGIGNVLKYGASHAPAETRKYVQTIMGKDSAGEAIERAKRNLSSKARLATAPLLPQPLLSQDATDEASQNVSRGTPRFLAESLTSPEARSKLLSQLQPDQALELLLALGEDDEEDDPDALLGLMGGNGDAAQ